LKRRKAIQKALELANKNDVVIITGKGSEPSICLKNGQKKSWDDRRVVQEEFQKRKY
jgi:UDP-N-acetylmuramoyl-L-alanyl-D-glutamate--2,6-diaminopimelate ligase